MKIKKQYDLLRKIKHSKEGISTSEHLFVALSKGAFIHLNNLVAMIVTIMSKNIELLKLTLPTYSIF